MSNDDVFDQVRALHVGRDSDQWATSELGRSVMARAMISGSTVGTPERTRRPRNRRFVAGVAAAGLVLAATTAAATIKAVTGDHPVQAGCYESLSADASTTEASAALVDRVGATEACRQTFAELKPSIDTTSLVSCINSNGGRGVFPAPRGLDAASACGQIGWQADADGN